ncbi:MAG: MOSC domain-containing protein [Rhodospirillaceae bacterium]|nr:MOSC domain-containing protein [Rhodospirillaceae bacterium]MBT4490120.1 MOSC domain-containing protein [Rhodospirillaceae bacterium]MBT5192091.1 MOSC domain-containing protein [Rhodospirillaceae bacterium]MBT5898472.1 MOSC domain-containing protein [Rhodospirillaceae bacterium]MBT6427777.1 MOSC domain-containing protein [Rhodospirillaceae bacterium]
MARIAQIFRYPVKGLSPEAMAKAEVTPGKCIPLDRAFALAHGSTQFDTVKPKFLPKTKFLMLARNERLAALRSRYLDESQELVIEREGKQVARGRLDLPVGRQMIEQFFAAYMGDEVRGSPKLLRARGHTFSDVPRHCLSLINISSLRELERVMKMPLDPLRFRANLYFDTGTPWQEFEWCDKEFQIGGVSVQGLSRIQRCAATNVNLETAGRDANIPLQLQQAFGHADMGIYIDVVKGGTINLGDTVTPPP